MESSGLSVVDGCGIVVVSGFSVVSGSGCSEVSTPECSVVGCGPAVVWVPVIAVVFGSCGLVVIGTSGLVVIGTSGFVVYRGSVVADGFVDACVSESVEKTVVVVVVVVNVVVDDGCSFDEVLVGCCVVDELFAGGSSGAGVVGLVRSVITFHSQSHKLSVILFGTGRMSEGQNHLHSVHDEGIYHLWPHQTDHWNLFAPQK